MLAPLDLLARLCALIPPPRFDMLRYHGVLAAHAKARRPVVPGPVAVATEPTQIGSSFDGEATELEAIAKQPAPDDLARVLADLALGPGPPRRTGVTDHGAARLASRR